jgi:murein DD-endopeptidase MepM/ murein hydrolase activator NlpD
LYGLTVKIDYGEGGDPAGNITARYSHCSALLVSAGQTVKAGDVIARVGSTGQVTGAHLDLEILKDGELMNPIYYLGSPR